MPSTVVWLDHRTAKIFKLVPKEMETESVDRVETQGSVRHKEEMTEKYYHQLATRLNTATEVLLIGPGTAKQDFMHHLEKHHHQNVAKKVVGMETVDHPTENQVLEKARKFFKKFDLYNTAQ